VFFAKIRCLISQSSALCPLLQSKATYETALSKVLLSSHRFLVSSLLDTPQTANKHALDAKITDVKFQLADVDQRLPFDDETFEAVMCVDSMNHFRDRLGYLKEWHRVLKSGKRALFTDPVVITGPVSNEELAARSNIGFFLFVPLEITENLIKEAGFKLIRREDVTRNIELTSGRWHASRQKHREDLIKIEGEERFDGLQKFFSTVHTLTSERRLSRFVFLAEK
jgi:SAM-dependent methyltransferase